MALQMARLDFNNDDEKELIDAVYANAIDTLGEDDRQLPQVIHMLPLLRRGIGIHHGGLLPLLKEVVEILFQEGLVKWCACCLFLSACSVCLRSVAPQPVCDRDVFDRPEHAGTHGALHGDQKV